MNNFLESSQLHTDLSFPEYFLNIIKRHEKKIALICGTTHDSYTYRDIYTLVTKAGSALRRRGVAKGHVVCIFSSNTIDYVNITLAITSIGATVTTANPAYTVAELTYQLKDSAAQFLFASEEILDTALTASRNYDQFKELFVIGRSDCFTTLDSLYKDDGSLFLFEKVHPTNDTMTLLYSSGTTGLPKGVITTYENYFHSLQTLNSPDINMYSRQQSENVLLFLPLFHMFGLSMMHLYLARGDLVVIMKRFSVNRLLQLIANYKVSTMPIIPPVAVILSKTNELKRYDISSLKSLLCAAASLRHETIEDLHKATGIFVQQAFGMTETTGIVTYSSLTSLRQNSNGTFLPGVERKIIDTLTGKTLPPYEDGELCIRGKMIMKGYLNNNQATNETIDKEQWLHTGDLAHLDQDGHLYITGRLKEIIKCNAYQISPAEIEAKILQHPDVVDVAVIGVPHEQAGEIPKAFVVKRSTSLVTEQDIKDFVFDKVASYKRLEGGVEFIAEIPKLPSGKILRRKLVELEKNRTKAKL